MMKLFKKKKSNNKLSETLLQQQKTFEISTVSNVNYKKPVPLLPEQATRSSTPPSIIMPKPRRALTPTRAILGRFDNDKTQVEEEEEHQQEISPPDMISPILLPTAHEEEAISALPKKNPLPNVFTGSTVASDESSRVYESALESLTDDEEDDNTSFDLPSLTFLQKQTLDKHNLSDTSSRTASPLKKPQRIPVQSSSLTTIQNIDISRNKNLINTRDINQIRDTDKNKTIKYDENNRQENTQENNRLIQKDSNVQDDRHDFQQNRNINQNEDSQNNGNILDNEHMQNNRYNHDNRYTKENKQTLEYNPVQGHTSVQDHRSVQEYKPIQDYKPVLNQAYVRKQDQDINRSSPNEKLEQEKRYEELQIKVEMMERQLALDREEFSKMEKELLTHRHEMMETLIRTKEQLNNVLKNRGETKTREMQYQQQLKQQQLQQLKQVTLQHLQQGELQEFEVDDMYKNDDLSDTEYYLREQEASQMLDNQQDKFYNTRIIKSKSQEYLKNHNSRSSSRASTHNNQYYQQYSEDGRRTLSRHNSSTSIRSNILDPSPSNTIVANPLPRRRVNRPRSRSIETGRFQEEHQLVLYNAADAQQQYYPRPRRSRSVGRRSRSVVYYEEDTPKYDQYYEEPRFYTQQDHYNDEYYMQPQHQQYYYNQYHSQPAPPTRQQASTRYPSNGSRQYSNYH